jgi:hypothetical protein
VGVEVLAIGLRRSVYDRIGGTVVEKAYSRQSKSRRGQSADWRGWRTRKAASPAKRERGRVDGASCYFLHVSLLIRYPNRAFGNCPPVDALLLYILISARTRRPSLHCRF